jgi:xanthine dehydrogenase YagS FAD-binding subunit
MRPFQYCSPRTEAEAVAMLSDAPGTTAVLAGGTDLVSLLKSEVLGPERVVDISGVESLRTIEPADDGGVTIGALATLEDLAASALLADYPSLSDVVRGVKAIQVQQQGTVGGDLCCLPNCWYFRQGFGLLARRDGVSLPEQGDNRYHAILGNRGPAKFVSASRLAPALIAWGAQARIAGPRSSDERWLPLADLYLSPKTDAQGITVLKPGQLLTHLRLPASDGRLSGAYEVLELNGLDWPQAACAATLRVDASGVIQQALVVLGHVAPTPWISAPATSALIGQRLSTAAAELAARAAVSEATPLSGNEYKVLQAQAAVKRSILRAAGENV